MPTSNRRQMPHLRRKREEHIPDYELQRDARVEENKKRMLQLGLLNLSQTLVSSTTAAFNLGVGGRSFVKSVTRSPTPSHTTPTPTPNPRRSSRLQSTPAPCYKQLWQKDSYSVPNKSEYSAAYSTSRGSDVECYTKEHETLLGSYSAQWELFKDGYDTDGARIYDPVRGKTCHQCRQKTVGLRTWCRCCESLQGQFCGDCLFMRYGENLLEVNQNDNWKCPSCRGICNCSICRVKKGWTPTGSFYKKATSLGYKSVAHYLVLSRQTSGNEGSTEKSECTGTNLEDSLHSAPPSRRLLNFASEEMEKSTHPQNQQKPDIHIEKSTIMIIQGHSLLDPNGNERSKTMLSTEDDTLNKFSVGFVKLEKSDDCQSTMDIHNRESHVAGDSCYRIIEKVTVPESSIEICVVSDTD